MKIVKSTVLIMAVLALAACASNKKPPKESDESGEKITVQIITTPEVNPNIRGEAAPIRIDLYQLSSSNEFKMADYFEVTDKPESVLGDKLIQHNRFILYPDTVTVLPMKLDSNLKYVGVIANYRDLTGSDWRLSLVKQNRHWYQVGGRYLYLKVDGAALTQITKSEMAELLKEYESRHPDDPNVRNGRARKTKNDMGKGIFRTEH